MSKRNSEKQGVDCGVIMPISATEGYSEGHWSEVRSMIFRSAEKAAKYQFKPSLVSEADESHIIHNTIIRNIYFNEIVVCDVSSKNPNVMFELGLRLAFGKPVVIIKDDKTNYSFDTSSILHLQYHSDMSYSHVDSFQDSLAEKLESTYEMSLTDDYVPFVKQFGNYELEILPTQKVSTEKYLSEISDRTQEILIELGRLKSGQGANISREQLAQKFIESYIESAQIDPNKLIGNIDAIVKASTSDRNLSSLFGSNDELEKFIANLIIRKL